MTENNNQLMQQTRKQIATLMHIPEKLDHSTSNGHSFWHASPIEIKSFLLER
jgi:hypothetical protein